MATIQANSGPTSRIESGDLVLAAAETVDTTPIKGRLAKFKQAHAAYVAAQKAVAAAEEALRKAEALVGERDADQDEALDQMANALIADGESRINPFKSFGFAAPASIRGAAHGEEAKTLKLLAAAVRKRKGIGKDTIAKAQAVDKAAQAVEAAIAAVGPAKKAHAAALAKREAVALPWEKTFAALKRGARAAEDDGAEGLFAVLFQKNAPKAPSPGTRAKRGERKAAKEAARQAKAEAKQTVAAAQAEVVAAEEALEAARVRLKTARENLLKARTELRTAAKPGLALEKAAAGGEPEKPAGKK